MSPIERAQTRFIRHEITGRVYRVRGEFRVELEAMLTLHGDDPGGSVQMLGPGCHGDQHLPSLLWAEEVKRGADQVQQDSMDRWSFRVCESELDVSGSGRWLSSDVVRVIAPCEEIEG